MYMKQFTGCKAREYTQTAWQLPLSGVHSIMMEKLAQPVEVGWCTPTPFHYFYHHVQSCGVRSSEGADKYNPPIYRTLYPHTVYTIHSMVKKNTFTLWQSNRVYMLAISVSVFCGHSSWIKGITKNYSSSQLQKQILTLTYTLDLLDKTKIGMKGAKISEICLAHLITWALGYNDFDFFCQNGASQAGNGCKVVFWYKPKKFVAKIRSGYHKTQNLMLKRKI